MMRLLSDINNLDQEQKDCLLLLEKATPLHESFFQKVRKRTSKVWDVFYHLQVTKRIYNGEPDISIDNSVVDTHTPVNNDNPCRNDNDIDTNFTNGEEVDSEIIFGK
eukprot:Pgem_evm1s17594